MLRTRIGLWLACVLMALDCGLVFAADPPKVTAPTMFNTPTADAVVSKLQIFPADNPWHEDVSQWKVAANSKAIVAAIGTEKPLRYNTDMAFIFVPPDQKRVPLLSLEYKDESDPGP